MLSALLTLVALTFYIIAGACYGAILYLQAPFAPTPEGTAMVSAPVSRLGRPFLFLGAFAQFCALGAWCVTTQRTPFASAFGTLSVTAWAIALAFGVLDTRRRLPAVGAIALLAACLILFLGLMQARNPVAQTPILAGQAVSLHVLAILSSFGLFAVSSACAALYLLQRRLLKQRRNNALFRRLPPLETLDRTAYNAVAFAQPLLTIGLTLGFLRALGPGIPHPPGQWLTDPHTLAAVFTWALYLFYFLARLSLGWRGARLQYLLIIGLLLALGVSLMPSATHRFD